jgi:adenylate kinase family enzyme
MARHDRSRVITEAASKVALADLSSNSRLIVTGQIGCGKTTLAERISTCLGVSHLHIDDYHHDKDPLLSATKAADSIDGGWVAEACVWQIPPPIWESADLVIYLDYVNSVHYLRILRRCVRNCLAKRIWTNIRDNVRGEWLHLKIMYRYADENRATWRERGGITSVRVPVIRSASPRASRIKGGGRSTSGTSAT